LGGLTGPSSAAPPSAAKSQLDKYRNQIMQSANDRQEKLRESANNYSGGGAPGMQPSNVQNMNPTDEELYQNGLQRRSLSDNRYLQERFESGDVMTPRDNLTALTAHRVGEQIILNSPNGQYKVHRGGGPGAPANAEYVVQGPRGTTVMNGRQLSQMMTQNSMTFGDARPVGARSFSSVTESNVPTEPVWRANWSRDEYNNAQKSYNDSLNVWASQDAAHHNSLLDQRAWARENERRYRANARNDGTFQALDSNMPGLSAPAQGPAPLPAPARSWEQQQDDRIASLRSRNSRTPESDLAPLDSRAGIQSRTSISPALANDYRRRNHQRASEGALMIALARSNRSMDDWNALSDADKARFLASSEYQAAYNDVQDQFIYSRNEELSRNNFEVLPRKRGATQMPKKVALFERASSKYDPFDGLPGGRKLKQQLLSKQNKPVTPSAPALPPAKPATPSAPALPPSKPATPSAPALPPANPVTPSGPSIPGPNGGFFVKAPDPNPFETFLKRNGLTREEWMKMTPEQQFEVRDRL
jgi:hypothetical protein